MDAKVLAVAAAMALPGPAWGALSAGRGALIFREAHQRDRGYGEFTADVAMELRDKSGASTTRLMDISVLESADGGARSLIVFNQPFDVRGTKILTHSRPAKADEQWIFLPAFNSATRISDSNKTAAFMGSEFTYEDIGSINIIVPKFSYRFLREGKAGKHPCLVVERTPLYADSGYRRQVVWMDAKEWIIRKVEFYGRNGGLRKTLDMGGYRLYLGRHWRADTMTMTNLRNGRVTVLRWSRYRFRAGPRPAAFREAALKR